jgi:hypothetical protein
MQWFLELLLPYNWDGSSHQRTPKPKNIYSSNVQIFEFVHPAAPLSWHTSHSTMVDPMAWPPPSPPNKNSSYLEKVCHSHSQGIPTTGIFKIIVPSEDFSSSYTSPFATRKFDEIETDLFYHHPWLKQNPSMPLKLIHNSTTQFANSDNFLGRGGG